MAEDVYVKLREFLDAMPGGFPATETGVEMKILKKLFTQADASMALCLTSKPESAEVIAERCGLEVSEAEERLESMYGRGLIFRTREDGRNLYRAEQYVVGIYEYQLGTMDSEFAGLMEEYFPFLGMQMLANKTKQMRVIPIGSAVAAEPAVASYERVRELVKGQDAIAVGNCICREQQRLLGHDCGRPFEGCMTLGSFAELAAEKGMMRRISVEEAMQVLDRSEEAGEVLQTNNVQDIEFVCSCCSCCCGALKGLKLFPNPADFVQSSFHSHKDLDKCTACETCIERCPMDAVTKGEEGMQVDLARCIGCGVCVSTCPQEAISLVPRESVLVPPVNMEEMLNRISTERGLA